MIGVKPKKGSLYLLNEDYGDWLVKGDILLCSASGAGHSEFSLIKPNMKFFEEGERVTNPPSQKIFYYEYDCLSELIETTFFTDKKVYYKIPSDKNPIWNRNLDDNIVEYIIIALKYCNAIMVETPEQAEYYICLLGYDEYGYEEYNIERQNPMYKFLPAKHKKIYRDLSEKFTILNEVSFMNYYFGDMDVKV